MDERLPPTKGDKLRDSYQRLAAVLLSSKPDLSSYFSKSALDATRNFPLLITDNVPAKWTNTAPHMGTSSFVGNDFICECCGHILTPGKFGTTARVKSLTRSRSQRRRASRNQRKAILTEERNSKRRSHGGGGGKTEEWNDPSSAREINNVLRTKHRSSTLVKDGTASNCLVYACGICDTRRMYKGVAVSKRKCLDRTVALMASGGGKKSSQKRRLSYSVEKKSVLFSDTANEDRTVHASMCKTPSKSSSNTGGGDGASASLDYMPLGGTASRSSTKKNKSHPLNASSAPSSLPQVEGTLSFISPSSLSSKKKKKRKRKSGANWDEGPPSSKSGIMEYLSSLND